MAGRGMTATTLDPVLWWSVSDDHPGRGYWDQTMLGDVLEGRLWPGTGLDGRVPGSLAEGGQVVVVPGRAGREHLAALNEHLAGLDWCLLVVTSDEERQLDLSTLTLPERSRVWLQNPHDRDHDSGRYQRALPVGYTPHVRAAVGFQSWRWDACRWSWGFVGQDTHVRRRAMRDAMAEVRGGDARYFQNFTGKMKPGDYVRHLLQCRFVPCPGGPVLPDTFRLWETLLVGACPLVDWYPADTTATGNRSYWTEVGWPDAPTIADWRDAPTLMLGYEAIWPDPANRSSAWWFQYRRRVAGWLGTDLAAIDADRGTVDTAEVTAIVTMSPIRSHPDLKILDETIRSISNHLPGVDIIVACDGVRPEQADMEQGYRAAVAGLVERCRAAVDDLDHPYRRVVPWIADEWWHQAGVTRRVLDELVDSPLILFVEHDTPLTDGPIDWAACIDDLMDDHLDVIRFHHEAQIHPEHVHLMVDQHVPTKRGAAWWRTRQWSQRPHLARTAYYRGLLAEHFPTSSRTMIEDVMHSVVQGHGWQANRLGIYQPREGSMVRSLHLDGRAGAPKYDMRFQ